MPSKSKCLCQLCSCGRHRCPKNCAMIPEGSTPPETSEYRLTYITKPFEAVKNYKPNIQLQLASEPISDKTTNRNDFIRHPLAERTQHKSDQYYPSEGVFDGTTNYRAEFIRKPIDPAKQIEKKFKQMCLPPFNGQTSNKTDFIRWPLSYERVKKKEEYRPLNDPFDGSTMYRTNYITHPSAVRESMKPSTTALLMSEPLQTRTENKEQFIRHPLPEKQVVKNKEYYPLDCVIDDTTIYRQEFMRKPIEHTPSYKPHQKPLLASEPLDSQTTSRTDYIRWSLDKPFQRQKEPYHPPDGQMTSDTTHRVEFTRKPINVIKVQSQKPVRTCILAPFQGVSTYKNEFIRWNADPPQRKVADPYLPLDGQFEGNTSYRTDFIRMPDATRKSMKPDTTALLACAPLESGTEYRKEFIRKAPEPCVAGLIQSGADTGLIFEQQDSACHKWYKETDCAA